MYASYYHTQICVHRQFIPPPPSSRGRSSTRRTSHFPATAGPEDAPSLTEHFPYSSPSLAICTSAARACLRVLRVQVARTERCTGALVAVHTPLFAAGLVRLLGMWASGRADPEAEADVRSCVAMLERVESQCVYSLLRFSVSL